ncbi:MAG: amidohydrolase family protein, partial [Enterococcus faecalis]
SYIRTHVNIDPYVELENFWGVKRALEKYAHVIDYDIVVFPQHGLLKNPQTVLLMREALKNGGTMVGGLDPAGIDYAIEESLETIFDLAEEFQVGIDIHLHDTGEVGVYTIDRFLDILEERKFTQRTAISHAFALLDVRPAEKEKLYQRLATHQTAIMSTIPYDPRYLLPPIDVLRQTGVSVHLGSDGFFDSWSSNVSGDLFEKLRNFCEMTGKITEEQFTQAYVHGCGKEAPFSFEEERLWFTEGDEANFIFTEAASTAEVIARKPQKRQIMLKGQWV